MNSHRQTKRALLTSVMALVMCVVMLLGTTFAWFTDTARTSVNKIEAGNLDVELLDAGGQLLAENVPLKWETQDTGDVLWEPNCTYNLEQFKIKNAGNLALKYKVILTAADISAKNGKTLLDVIDWTIKLNNTVLNVTSEQIKADLGGGIAIITDQPLKAGEVETISITGHMKAEADNDYQSLYIDKFGITVVATQYTYEYDSTRNDYDKFAEYPEVTTVQIAAGEATAVNDAVKNAITAAKTVDSTTGKTTPTQIVLPANATVTLDTGVATPAQGLTSDIKITGDKTTTVKLQNNNPGSEGKLSYQDNANLTFQGITIDSSAISGICARGGVVTFIDCTFNGELKKTIASKFVFSGCTFTQPVSQVGYGCKDVVFDDCKFNTDGYGIKIYSEGSTPVNLTVKNCAFENTGSAAKSAIFLDHIIDGISYNITVDNCTFDGFTTTPTPNFNAYATREIVTGSFVKTATGQYIFSYQTGETGGGYHKILTADQLVVTVK